MKNLDIPITKEEAAAAFTTMVSRSRGRTRKNNAPGNRRIDAALDAMLPYGFNERLVRETVNELLDVYEGT